MRNGRCEVVVVRQRGINVPVRMRVAKINLIGERTRAKLPLRDVGPFRHFRHYINEETRRAAPARLPAPYRNGYDHIVMFTVGAEQWVTSRSQARLDPTALVSGWLAPRGAALIKAPRGRRPFSEFVPSPSGELTNENSDGSR